MNLLRRRAIADTPAAVPSTDSAPDLHSIPAYVEAEQFENDLRQRLEAAVAERKEIAERVFVGPGEDRGNETQIRVAALLGKPAVAPQQGDRLRLQSLNDDIAALRLALEHAEEARRQAWVAASATICDAFAGQHRELLANLAGHLVEVQKAWLAYDDFLQQFVANNIAYGRLRPNRPDFLGPGPRIPRSDLRIWLRELAKAGFIPQDQLPEGCR